MLHEKNIQTESTSILLSGLNSQHSKHSLWSCRNKQYAPYNIFKGKHVFKGRCNFIRFFSKCMLPNHIIGSFHESLVAYQINMY